MSKLTNILAGVSLAILCGAGSGATAYADLQYVFTQVSYPHYPNGGTTLYTDFTLSVQNTAPGVTSAVFYDGIGAIQATGFTNNPFWGINLTMQNGFALSSGSIFPTGLWSTDVSSHPFQNPHPLTGLNTELVQFHAPGGGTGAGVDIPAEGLLLANFSVYYSDTSEDPTVSWIPNSYSDSRVSHVWTETTGTTTTHWTDKNGGKVTSVFTSGLNSFFTVFSGETVNFTKTELEATLAMGYIGIETGGKLVLTEDPNAPRQSAEIVTEIEDRRFTLNGVFDITNHDLIIHNSTLSDVQDWVTSGKLTTSTAGKVVIYGLAGDRGIDEFDTLHVYPDDILVELAYAGDANLDGMLTGEDFAQIDAAFLSGLYTSEGAEWIHGDCNYDGKITLADFALMDAAFTIYYRTNSQMALARAQADAARFGSEFTALYDAALASAVPEPASLGVLLLGGGGLLIRRRR